MSHSTLLNDINTLIERHTKIIDKYKKVLKLLEEGKEYHEMAKNASTEDLKKSLTLAAEAYLNYVDILVAHISEEKNDLNNTIINQLKSIKSDQNNYITLFNKIEKALKVIEGAKQYNDMAETAPTDEIGKSLTISADAYLSYALTLIHKICEEY